MCDIVSDPWDWKGLKGWKGVAVVTLPSDDKVLRLIVFGPAELSELLVAARPAGSWQPTRFSLFRVAQYPQMLVAWGNLLIYRCFLARTQVGIT